MNYCKKYTAEVLPKFHPLFAGFQFAASARIDDESRQAINHVLVERDEENDLITYVVATDGRRMHVHVYDAGMFDDDICDEMLTPGLYVVVAKSAKQIVIARNDDDEIEFPNWRVVATDWKPQHTAAVNAQTVGIVSAKTGNLYAVDFLRQACGFGAGSKSETVHITYGSETPLTPIVIESELGRAYVMPIQWQDDAEDEKTATRNLPNLRIVEDSDEDEDEPELI